MTIAELAGRVRASGYLPGPRVPADAPPPDKPVNAYGNTARGWRQLVFPCVFLVYLVQTVTGVFAHSSGPWIVVGLVVLAGYCVAYVRAMTFGVSGQYRRFWRNYGLMVALTVAEGFFAHQDALVMLVYIAVLSVAAQYAKAIPTVLFMVAVAAFLPPLIGPWHAKADYATAISIGIVSLAMYGFFGVVRSNEALAEARTEVARLAAENERTRIARDLHDLLGHSLTTITVKAALANRLAAVDPDRAAREIAEVEALTRRTLADVRGAVSGYREVTLASELATAREVLRAAGITAVLPGAIDSIGTDEAQLFAWVVREGVTNVVRHSRARTCEIRLGPYSIEIIDDGVGTASSCGNGLTGLQERVDALGGRLSVQPGRPGASGWRMRVDLAPLDAPGTPQPAAPPAVGVTQ